MKTARLRHRAASGAVYTPPISWDFAPDTKWMAGDRFYYFPTRLVTDGTVAKLWKEKKGGRVAVSILVVIGLFAETIRYARHKRDGTPFSDFTEIDLHPATTYRMLARIVQCSPNTVTEAVAVLTKYKLVRQTMGKGRHGMPVKRLIVTANCLTRYTGATPEPYVVLTGFDIMGGLWTLLPPSMRCLYLVARALDPIRHSAAWRTQLKHKHPSWTEEHLDRRMSRTRRASARTVREWLTFTGLSAGEFYYARRALTKSSAYVPALLKSGVGLRNAAGQRVGRWFARDRSFGYKLSWTPDDLNDVEDIERWQHELWPRFFER